tara:strand:+ start:1914 stop:3857 length:1944 start_codon:yes stop_codon:yes gene_type:complete
LQIGKDIRVKLQTSPSVQLNFRGTEKKLRRGGITFLNEIKMQYEFKKRYKAILAWSVSFYDHNINSRMHFFKNLLIIFLCLGFVSFWLINPLKSIYDNWLVSPFLSPFLDYPIEGYSFLFYLALWVVLSVFLVWRAVVLEYIINGYVLLLIFLILGLYLGERLFWLKYDHLKLYSQIKVLDPIYFSLILIAIISFFNSIKWEFDKKSESWLELDLPKSKIEQDKLNRVNEVDNFIQLLNSLPKNEKRSHVIGLVGSWGYGKTSFLSMFKEKLDGNSVVVEFNPWITSSTSNLIEDFFVLLDDKVSEHIQTNKSIYKYGRALSNLNQESNLIIELRSLILPEKPLNERIKNISSLVTKLDRKVFCIVDDLDRLDSDEVFEVLRIVRNTANFPNFIFVMAYDKDYLIHSLKNRDIYNAEKYLDKIVQVEIALPWISKFKLIGELMSLIKSKIEVAFAGDPNLQDSLSNQVRKLIFENESEKNSKYIFDRSIISELFLNLRDVIKFSNSFVYFLKNHHQNIYVPDLFFLELIKFIDISILSRLAANDFMFVNNKDGLNYFEIYDEGMDSDDGLSLFAPSTTISEILKDHVYKFRLITLINKSFSLPDETDYNSEYSVCYVDNFEYYFSFYLNDNQVSFDFINRLIKEDEF